MTRRPRIAPDDSHATLERGGGLAAWRQIADALEADISESVLALGEKLPGEMLLAERFGVNRHTVRRALAALATRGLVRAVQGGGTFVMTKPLAYPIGPRTRFSEIVSRAGREASGDLISSAPILADAQTAKALCIAPGAPVLELVTIHKADGVPISTGRTWVPLPRFAGLDATYRKSGSLTRAYDRHGVSDYSRLSTRISARIATRDEAALLELAAGHVILVIDSINVDQDGQRIQATRSHFAADRVDLVIGE